ncbi:glycosyltransferase [Methanosarcina mazei Go1]|uniref:Glycosyltransferase n=1 Tax=Methanosarcina mazei (strain ATCC BAA-159 / DSM 3647 / Goe1 / Go1 / JCM 11833 / OCM 88) TaxID=192952 RepID=Q8PZ42_METMA|nr:glycosyltransferase family 2 protein [Methanosarcina mazei]AAM30348.1 glycosyltransferase [Methanosarcina mazei Go1]WIM47370.1 glycosyltransferase family 2 protein [Methanosarcina mazei]
MLDQKPKVSVIIPTYNRAHLIPRAIKSVLNQTYLDIEIIIVDDSSTDNTEEIVKDFKDRRLKYIRHNINKGASAARNTGIRESRGKYIAFQDSDDEWFSNKLEKQIEAFADAPPEVGIVYSGFYRIEANRKLYLPSDQLSLKEGNIHNELLKGNFVGTPTVLMKKECFRNQRYFNESLPALEDWELWIELSKYYTFRYIKKPLLCSYSTPNSINLNENNMLKAHEIILLTHLDDFSKNKKNLSEHYYDIGTGLCSIGNFNNGKNYLIKSLKAYCLNFKTISVLFILLFGHNIYYKFRDLHRKIGHRT